MPMREGSGAVTQDIAKPHHVVTLTNAPTWTTIACGLTVLAFDNINQYFQSAAAGTADLNFTSGDYSIVGWVNLTSSVSSNMVMARYALDVDGWEFYFYNNILSLRHNHASLAPTRESCFSLGWSISTWMFVGLTRRGLYPKMYRNGVPVTVTYDVLGMRDPDTANRKLLNCRFTEGSDFLNGSAWNYRIWGRELSGYEMWRLFEMERHLFGV